MFLLPQVDLHIQWHMRCQYPSELKEFNVTCCCFLLLQLLTFLSDLISVFACSGGTNLICFHFLLMQVFDILYKLDVWIPSDLLYPLQYYSDNYFLGDYFFLLISDWNSALRHACSQDAQTHHQLYCQYRDMKNSYNGEEFSRYNDKQYDIAHP